MWPDKIYVPYETDSQYISKHYYLGPTPKMENAEYIHKDALLEWAKEKATDYKGAANIRRSFEMMIRKIESL